jgi:hypothetical protein
VKTRFPRRPPLSPAAQCIALRQRAPFGITTLTRNGVNWKGTICPSDFARSYTVELNYLIGASPKVWVRELDLKQLANGRSLPHVYDQKTQRLCLYLPDCGFWRPTMAIACTIIPWTALWLYNFEIWLVTDVWHTKGEHPDVSSDKSERCRVVPS